MELGLFKREALAMSILGGSWNASLGFAFCSDFAFTRTKKKSVDTRDFNNGRNKFWQIFMKLVSQLSAEILCIDQSLHMHLKRKEYIMEEVLLMERQMDNNRSLKEMPSYCFEREGDKNPTYLSRRKTRCYIQKEATQYFSPLQKSLLTIRSRSGEPWTRIDTMVW